MQPFDCAGDGVGGFLCRGASGPGIFLLVSVNGFKIAKGFFPDRFAGGFVVDEDFEFALPAAEGPFRFGIVETQAALLENGIFRESDSLPIFHVSDFGCTDRFACCDGGLHCQSKTVDGLVWRVQEQMGDIVRALLMFEEGVLAVEGDLPHAEAAAEFVWAKR